MLEPCRCPETLSHIEQMCETCQREYCDWLETATLEARAEVRMMSTAELFGQLIVADMEEVNYAA